MFARAILLERIGQPYIETHLFSIGRSHKIRLSGQQAFRRSQSNKILRSFDLALEVFVFCFDVIDRFLRSVRLSVANESRVRFTDIIEEIIDRLVQRLRREDLAGRDRQKNKGGQNACASTHENNSASAVLPRASYPAKKEIRDKQVGRLDRVGYGPECRRRFAVALQDENHR